MVEFVGLTACMMALTALSLDAMLPTLPAIGAAFQVADPNHLQWVILVYLLGFAAGHPIHGPLSDHFGRRPVLLLGLAIYLASTVAALLAGSFTALLLARLGQGLGAAAPRVIAIAILRDRFQGRAMSRVMSFVMMVFIVVPVIAPTIGAGLLQIAPWQAPFVLLMAFAVGLAVWVGLRLEESLPSGSPRIPVLYAVRIVVTTRASLGYMLAIGFVFGNLMTYISTAEQIFVTVYGLGAEFTLVFGAIALGLVAAAFSNARIVERVGMRRVSHAALLGYVALCLLAAALGFPEQPPLPVFAVVMAASFFCVGHILPNFNALAMEPLGQVAGVGSALIGFYMTAAGAVFGGLIGRLFDGTVRPMEIGFTVLAVLALLTVLVTERGKLFGTGESAPAQVT